MRRIVSRDRLKKNANTSFSVNSCVLTYTVLIIKSKKRFITESRAMNVSSRLVESPSRFLSGLVADKPYKSGVVNCSGCGGLTDNR